MLVAMSTTEAELIALSTATQEAIWLKSLAEEVLLLAKRPMTMYCDNQSTVVITQHPEQHFSEQTKHITQ